MSQIAFDVLRGCTRLQHGFVAARHSPFHKQLGEWIGPGAKPPAGKPSVEGAEADFDLGFGIAREELGQSCGMQQRLAQTPNYKRGVKDRSRRKCLLRVFLITAYQEHPASRRGPPEVAMRGIRMHTFDSAVR